MKTQPRTAQSAAAANGKNGTSIRFGAVGVGLCLGALITVASVIWAVGYEPELGPSAPNAAVDAQIEDDADPGVRAAAIRALGASTSATARAALAGLTETAGSAADREAAAQRLARTQARLASADELKAVFSQRLDPRMANAQNLHFEEPGHRGNEG